MKILSFIILLIILFFAGCKNNYEKGMELLKNNEYDKALTEFNKIDSLNKDFNKAKSKINYVNGVINFNENNLVTAYKYLNLINGDDEYFKEAKILRDNIEANKTFCYEYGLNFFDLKDYQNALKYFDKIKEGDENFNEARNKCYFIRGKELYDKKDYNEAWTTLYNIDSTDECYNDAKELMKKIDIALIPEKIKNHCIYIMNNSKQFSDVLGQWGKLSFRYAYQNADIFIDNLEKWKNGNVYPPNDLINYDPTIKEYIKLINNWMIYLIDWVKFFKEYWRLYISVGISYSDEWNNNLRNFREKKTDLENKIRVVQNKLSNKYGFDTNNSPF